MRPVPACCFFFGTISGYLILLPMPLSVILIGISQPTAKQAHFFPRASSCYLYIRWRKYVVTRYCHTFIYDDGIVIDITYWSPYVLLCSPDDRSLAMILFSVIVVHYYNCRYAACIPMTLWRHVACYSINTMIYLPHDAALKFLTTCSLLTLPTWSISMLMLLPLRPSTAFGDVTMFLCAIVYSPYYFPMTVGVVIWCRLFKLWRYSIWPLFPFLTWFCYILTLMTEVWCRPVWCHLLLPFDRPFAVVIILWY